MLSSIAVKINNIGKNMDIMSIISDRIKILSVLLKNIFCIVPS